MEKNFNENFEKAMAAVKSAEGGRTDIEARGTCQACFEPYVTKPYSKMKRKSKFTGEPMNYPEGSIVMVLHGYKRPGYGRVEGECWGVGHPPFELDCTITKHWRHYLVTDYLPATKKRLADLKSGKIKEFMFEVRARRRPGQSPWESTEVMTFFLTEGQPIPATWPSDSPPDFVWARKSRIKETESDIRHITADIEHLGKHIASWKYRPEALRPKTKPLTEGQAIRKWLDESAAELKKLKAPDDKVSRGSNFYEWVVNFPRTLAWSAMRTGARNPSYYKYVRQTYETMTGAKPLVFERAPRSSDVVSREQAEKLAVREAKEAARDAATKARLERDTKGANKAMADVAILQKALGDALDNASLMEALKKRPFVNPYQVEDKRSQHEVLMDWLTRYKLMSYINGETPISSTNAASVRRDLREFYVALRRNALEAGFKLKAL